MLWAVAACDPGGEAPRPLVLVADETWAFIPVDGMVCADGSQGGVFANRSDRSEDVVLFFRGGGICFDSGTCLFDAPMLDGLGADPLAAFVDEGAGRTGIFDRQDPTNPLQDATFLVFPHCTGDFHVGDVQQEHDYLGTLHQRGYRNVTAALGRIVATFPDPARVVVAGFSAGGVGAAGNYHQIANAFARDGRAPPLLMVDAGPLMRPPYLATSSQAQLRTAWNLDATLGPFCPECLTDGFHRVLERNRLLHPGMQSSLACAYDDGVVRLLYQVVGSGPYLSDGSLLHSGLLDLASYTGSLGDPPDGSRHRNFFYAGERHGALEVAPLADTPGLATFLADQLDGLPAWTNVEP